MKKWILYLNYSVLALSVLGALIVEIIMGYNLISLYTSLFIFLGVGVFETVMLVVQEANDLNSDDNLTRALFVSAILLVVFTTGDYYAVRYIPYHESYLWIFWVVMLIGIIASGVGLIVGYKIFKKKNKKPKFIVNKRKWTDYMKNIIVFFIIFCFYI